jgi:hypothetical protein
MSRTFQYVGLLLSFLVLSVASSYGWETDTHYGLTKWLAVKAGFSLEDAEVIALAAQSPDEGRLYPAPFAVAQYTCFGRDLQASRFVQEHHFPSYGPVPGQPQNRAVVAGLTDGAADLGVRKEIATNFADIPRQQALSNFGMPLHPLEDSWSHQGIPDVPPWPCSRELSWGHPQDRGGWRLHEADITYLHVSDILATSARVYELMLVYLDHHPSFRSHSPVPWSELEPNVKKFAEAMTKGDKKRWFSSDPNVPFSSYTYKYFLDSINIPDGDYLPAAPLWASQGGRILYVAQKTAPGCDCPQDFVELFLTLWIVKQSDTFLESVDISAAAARLAAGTEGFKPEPRLWVSTVFRMWLLRDHGLVSLLEHGTPVGGSGFSRLSEILQDTANYPPMRSESLEQAIRAPGTSAPFLLVAVPPENNKSPSTQNRRFAALFQFRHTPADAVALTIENRSGKWVVIGLDWFTE